MEVVQTITTCSEERACEICEPQGTKSIDERLARVPGDVELRDQQGHIRRDAVISPHLKDIGDQSGFLVKAAPLNLAGFERIVLERKECQVLKTIVSH